MSAFAATVVCLLFLSTCLNVLLYLRGEDALEGWRQASAQLVGAEAALGDLRTRIRRFSARDP